MTFTVSKYFFVLLFTFSFVLSGKAIFAYDDWKPITPEEVSMKTPKVEADADAEAIFWEVRVDDSSENLTMKHYIRVKIFSERGREKFSKVDIPFTKNMQIKNIEARVIKPDGTIVELKKDDIFDREIIKADKLKVKAKSFAVPNIDVGVIVEYRYREIYSNGSANNMRMVFQRDIPIQYSAYYFKAFSGVGTKWMSFNMPDRTFEKDKGGYLRLDINNVPSLKEEVQMPPEDEIRSWGLVYYDNNSSLDASNYWSRIGGVLAEIHDINDSLKPGGDSKKLVPQIIEGVSSPEEKLSKIFQYTRSKIRNLSYDTSLTDDEKKKLKSNKSPEDTIKKGQGFANDINDLFATLAVAAGFEARIVFTGDRSEIFFSRKYAHHSFVHRACVAIKVNGLWRYYDPGFPFLPEGMLVWYEENQDAFLLSTKDYLTTKTPLSDYSRSMAIRNGKFKLLEDGTLEGTVKTNFTGHLAYRYRINSYEDSENKREEDLEKEIKERFSTAEISDIKIENMLDANKPLSYSYNIKIPNYAQKTGKRLFLQPSFFKYGDKALFASSERKTDIYFQFPWSEKDSIEFDLPDGFSLDNAEIPSGIQDPQRIGSLLVNIGITSDKKTLVFSRDFYFGGGGNILFPVATYQPVKNMFDAFNKADSHTITLKQD